MSDIVQEPLFDEPENEPDTFKPNISVTASMMPVSNGDAYSVALPRIFPSKFEEEHIASGLVKAMEDEGINALEAFIGFKQLESVSFIAQEMLKEAATNFTRKNSVAQMRGVKVSMRSFASFWKYDDDVQADIDKVEAQIKKLKDQVGAIQKQAQAAGRAIRVSSGLKGLSIKFREV